MSQKHKKSKSADETKNGTKAKRKKEAGSKTSEPGGMNGTQKILSFAMAVLVILLAVSVYYVYQTYQALEQAQAQVNIEKRSTVDDSSPENNMNKGSSEEVKLEEDTSKKLPETSPDVPQPETTTPSPATKVYSKADITNSYDNKIRGKLDAAENYLHSGRTQDALKNFKEILTKYPQSPRGHFGLAEALGQSAEEQRSNAVLEESIEKFIEVVEVPDIPFKLLKEAVNIAVQKMHFRGWNKKAAKFVKRVVENYPNDVDLHNKLGVCYLVMGRVENARATFKEALNLAPKNGFAMVHYGFILKTTDDNSIGAIPYLETGIESGEPGTDDGRFYFHLGDALNRVGRKKESYAVYEEGAKKGHFLSKYQRSLYNVNTLTGRPWWTPEQTTYQKYLKMLEDNWQTIRDEGLAQMNAEKSGFQPEEENLREKGDWKQFTLWQQGRKNEKNCHKAPKTCALMEKIPDAHGCRRGQIKYSVMQPGVHVWPHCGPTNCRIRAHLGLVVPPGPKIRVAEKEGKWKEGKFIIFDDSFEHEVWHEGDSFRLVLIVDFWHPELTAHQKASLPAI